MNGDIRNAQNLSSDTNSDLVTVIMFNLDRLNDVKPEVRQRSTWEKGQIP